MTDADTDAKEQRRAWLATLAQAPRGPLIALAQRATEGSRFEPMREPETGLVMLRARIDGSGNRFNVGEATLVRCVLRLRIDDTATVGVGYCLGRDGERARCVAALDALLQQPSHHADVMQGVIEPLRRQIANARAVAQRRTAASRVVFHTLQGEAVR
jgi:alpha-D-ribose 1-methylphosphonate 5-triphosphate synthase subunit PhnG